MLLHSKILGQGQPLIILHGFLGMSDNWKTLGKRFAKQDFQVHLIDQRNHGRSFKSDAFNYELLVEDLKRYCKEYQLDDIILLGHSMGGKVAMLFATSYPEIVSKLIVADISPRYYEQHHQSILEGLTMTDLDVIKTRKDADTFLSNYVPEFGVRQFLLKNLYWIEKGQLALRVNIKVLKANIEEIGKALSENSVYNEDVLFLRGDKSNYINENDVVLIAKHFPIATVKTIADSGHWLHAENPNDFYDEVIQFIS